MAEKIVQIYKDKEHLHKEYPITVPEAIKMPDGRTLALDLEQEKQKLEAEVDSRIGAKIEDYDREFNSKESARDAATQIISQEAEKLADLERKVGKFTTLPIDLSAFAPQQFCVGANDHYVRYMYFLGVFVPVSGGDVVKVKAPQAPTSGLDRITRIYFLTQTGAEGDVVHYAGGVTTESQAACLPPMGGEEVSFVAPSDAKFMYVSILNDVGVSVTPISLSISGNVEYLTEKLSKGNPLTGGVTPKGFISERGWRILGGTYTRFVDVSDVRHVYLKANDTNDCFYTFVKAIPTADGESIQFAEGYGSLSSILGAGKSTTIKVPNDAVYLALYMADGRAPQDVNSLDFPLSEYVDQEIKKTSAIMSQSIEMQFGKLNGSGNLIGDLDRTDGDFFKNVHTPLFINSDIRSFETMQGETAKVYCFTAEKDFISVVDSIAYIPSNCEYIKIQLTKTTDYVDHRILSINGLNVNKVEKNVAREGQIHLSYEVKVPLVNFGADGEYYGDEGRYFDNGLIQLPPNYDATGKPVPLVIFCHGTNTYNFKTGLLDIWDSILDFICANGYAVADCCALSSKYEGDPFGDYTNSKSSPLSVACYTQFFDFLVKNYNIDASSLYVFGHSSGGLVSEVLSQYGRLPIRCVAELAPSLAAAGYDALRGSSAVENAAKWLSYVGYTNTASFGTGERLLNTTEKQLVLSQIDKIKPYDPMGFQSDINYRRLSELILYAPSDEIFGRVPEFTSAELNGIADNGRIYNRTPTKIWHAIDDNAVPYATSVIYQRMVKNAGGICHLRQIPANTGKHYAVCTDPNAPKCDYRTKFGGVITIAVAIAEMIDWFEEW